MKLFAMILCFIVGYICGAVVEWMYEEYSDDEMAD